MNKVNILGVNVDMVNAQEATDAIIKMLEENRPHSVFTPNSEIIMIAHQDEDFRAILNRSDLLTADGIGVVYASRILKKPIEERAAGYDIACLLLERISETGHRLFLFGGKEGVAEQAKENLLKQYPFLNIVGTRNGYFSPAEEEDIINQINRSEADIVFVCLGAPMQEKWIDRNIDKMKARALLGIGGSLDVFAGNVERAPEKWCNMGLEWLYRLIKEPWRIGRMMALPKFALTVLFKGKRYSGDGEEKWED